MTIDEAIAYARKEAEDKRADADWKFRHGRLNADDCISCAEEHEQLAEWLEELKSYRASVFSGDMTQKMLKEEYNKAIDDFAGRLIRYVDCGHLCSPTEMRWSDLSVVEMVKKLAEQLKAGGVNE